MNFICNYNIPSQFQYLEDIVIAYQGLGILDNYQPSVNYLEIRRQMLNYVLSTISANAEWGPRSSPAHA